MKRLLALSSKEKKQQENAARRNFLLPLKTVAAIFRFCPPASTTFEGATLHNLKEQQP
jgi:hypothetical protein